VLSTKFKIKLASFASNFIVRFTDRHQQVTRNSISWNLDLNEGIDLSIFLFGHFQRHVLKIIKHWSPANPVIFDVGANIGSISLPILKNIPGATVYSFEPTDWAFSKLTHNASLNPQFSELLFLFQMFLNDGHQSPPESIYSSWDLQQKHDTHPSHGGTLKKTSGATSATLDSVVNKLGLRSVDFIKIDTDGHEWDVLSGSIETLKTCRPVVLFEAGLDHFQERGLHFSDFHRFFSALDYSIHYENKVLDVHAAERKIRSGRTIDLLAVPAERLYG
jgi:FkbM family methyltransferase